MHRRTQRGGAFSRQHWPQHPRQHCTQRECVCRRQHWSQHLRNAKTLPWQGVRLVLLKSSFSYGLSHLQFSLFQQFIPPVLHLRGDLLDVAGLFDGLVFDMRGIRVAQFGVRQLVYGMGGVVVDALVEHLQHFDGGA